MMIDQQQKRLTPATKRSCPESSQNDGADDHHRQREWELEQQEEQGQQKYKQEQQKGEQLPEQQDEKQRSSSGGQRKRPRVCSRATGYLPISEQLYFLQMPPRIPVEAQGAGGVAKLQLSYQFLLGWYNQFQQQQPLQEGCKQQQDDARKGQGSLSLHLVIQVPRGAAAEPPSALAAARPGPGANGGEKAAHSSAGVMGKLTVDVQGCESGGCGVPGYRPGDMVVAGQHNIRVRLTQQGAGRSRTICLEELAGCLDAFAGWRICFLEKVSVGREARRKRQNAFLTTLLLSCVATSALCPVSTWIQLLSSFPGPLTR
jgi:hypothetical protein